MLVTQHPEMFILSNLILTLDNTRALRFHVMARHTCSSYHRIYEKVVRLQIEVKSLSTSQLRHQLQKMVNKKMLMMVCLTCSAPRHNPKQPTQGQHLVRTLSPHVKLSHPRFCCVHNMHAATDAFQRRVVSTLCGAHLTDKHLPAESRNAPRGEMSPELFSSLDTNRKKQNLLKFKTSLRTATSSLCGSLFSPGMNTATYH